MRLEEFQRHDVECGLMGGLKNDLRGLSGFGRFEPAAGAEAPAVAGIKSGKMELGRGRWEVVAAGLGEREELGGHDRANRVGAVILFARVAMTVAEKSRRRIKPAWLQRFAKNIARAVVALGAVQVSYHNILAAISVVGDQRCLRRSRISPSNFSSPEGAAGAAAFSALSELMAFTMRKITHAMITNWISTVMNAP